VRRLLEHVERAGIQAIGERVVHQVSGRSHEVALVGVFHAKTLKGAKVIPIPEFLEEFLLNGPEGVPALRTEFALDVALEIVLDVVVFEQRVVHVHQKDYRVGEGHKAG
jgi:hypothetical protein